MELRLQATMTFSLCENELNCRLMTFEEIFQSLLSFLWRSGGLMVGALPSGSSSVHVQALAGDIVLCSWARHCTLTVPLSTQVYKWVLVNFILGIALRWTSIPSRRSRNTSSRFMLLRPELSTSLMRCLTRTETLPHSSVLCL